MTKRPIRTRGEAASILTARQREVMDLLARGYTNAQVADALGISLDTAKFHVGEILARLEAPSREAAVEVWRERSRAPLRRLLAVLAVPRLAIAGAAVVAGLGVLAIIAVLGSTDDRTAIAAEPGVYIAAVQPAPDPEQERTWRAPVRVLDVVTGTERAFGPPDNYAVLAWSPDGSRLLAMVAEFPDDDSPAVFRLRMWDAAGHVLHEAELPGGLTGGPYWSPDGARIAFTGGRILLLSPDLRERAAVAVPSQGSDTPRSLTTQPWSEDSRLLVTPAGDGRVLLVDRDGVSTTVQPPASDQMLTLAGWVDGRLRVVSQGTDGAPDRQWLGTVGTPGIDWADPQAAPPDALGFAGEAVLDDLHALFPGWLAYRATRETSADGRATYFTLAELARFETGAEYPPVRAISLVIRVDDQEAVVDLGPSLGPQVDFSADIVVVPGWGGSLPGQLSAVTPLPAD